MVGTGATVPVLTDACGGACERAGRRYQDGDLACEGEVGTGESSARSV